MGLLWITVEQKDVLLAKPEGPCRQDEHRRRTSLKQFATPAQEFEDSHPLSGKSTADEDGGARRRDAVGRLVALGRSLGLHEECIHDSVQLLDRLSRMGLSSDTLASSVLGAIALISAKQGRALDTQTLSDTHNSFLSQCQRHPVSDMRHLFTPANGCRRHHSTDRCMLREMRTQPQILSPALLA